MPNPAFTCGTQYGCHAGLHIRLFITKICNTFSGSFEAFTIFFFSYILGVKTSHSQAFDEKNLTVNEFKKSWFKHRHASS